MKLVRCARSVFSTTKMTKMICRPCARWSLGRSSADPPLKIWTRCTQVCGGVQSDFNFRGILPKLRGILDNFRISMCFNNFEVFCKTSGSSDFFDRFPEIGAIFVARKCRRNVNQTLNLVNQTLKVFQYSSEQAHRDLHHIDHTVWSKHI